MSVLTPAKNGGGKRSAWDSDEEFDDEEDENFGPSPPKTMQFHIPQSRLMKTPGMYHPPLVCVQHHANLEVYSQGSIQAYC
jgi:hypothetical protein